MLILSVARSRWSGAALQGESNWWKEHPPKWLPDCQRASAALAGRFGLSRNEFVGKSVLDVGCGPTARLSWFDRAESSLGLDPLADVYLDRYPEFVAWYKGLSSEPIEEFMPRWRESFDWVLSFNALDHGYSLPLAIRNIAAYLRPGGGRALLSVGCDVINTPDACHPLKIHPQAMTGLLVAAGLEIEKQDQGNLPAAEGGQVVMKQTCTGGPVFHWWARKP